MILKPTPENPEQAHRPGNSSSNFELNIKLRIVYALEILDSKSRFKMMIEHQTILGQHYATFYIVRIS